MVAAPILSSSGVHPKVTTYWNAVVADESADGSCWATYLAAGKGLNVNSEGLAAPDGHGFM
jgi:hypothetical protein